MVKVNNPKLASELVKPDEYFGMSVFDGKWYCGKWDELAPIGVVDPVKTYEELFGTESR